MIWLNFVGSLSGVFLNLSFFLLLHLSNLCNCFLLCLFSLCGLNFIDDHRHKSNETDDGKWYHDKTDSVLSLIFSKDELDGLVDELNERNGDHCIESVATSRDDRFEHSEREKVRKELLNAQDDVRAWDD